MILDIKSDFYKRHGREGGVAEVCFCPTSVCLFACETYQVGLRLSFGATAAYRGRSDGRIILSRTDTNVKESVNRLYIDRFMGEPWAEEIINAVKKSALDKNGVEVLFHSDVGEPSLDNRLLCGVAVFSKLSEEQLLPQMLIKLTDKEPYKTASLTEGRIAIVNNATLSYMTYNPDFNGRKIIVIKTGKHRRVPKLSSSYFEREYARINSLSRSVSALGELMTEASRDMLKEISAPELETLFNEVTGFADEVRIMPDLTGAVLVCEEKNVDELVMIVGSRYEKKTGLTPAFYISD